MNKQKSYADTIQEMDAYKQGRTDATQKALDNFCKVCPVNAQCWGDNCTRFANFKRMMEESK